MSLQWNDCYIYCQFATIALVAERVWCEMLTILRINKLQQPMPERVCLCVSEKELVYDPGIIIIAMNIHINSLVACTIRTIHLHLINQREKVVQKKYIYEIKL